MANLTAEQKKDIEDRAERASCAVNAYASALGDVDDESHFTDLLADMMHLADATERDFDDELGRARRNYEAEIEGED